MIFISYIWVHRHRPQSTLAWWSANVPLVPGLNISSGNVRLLEYDFQCQLDEFIPLIDKFDGIELSQMSKPVPDSLWLERIDENSIANVLKSNGLISRFYLPHAFEYAVFESPDKTVLSNAVAHPEIQKLIISNDK